ncbi:hypothetical protein D3C86_1539610 [compost metagenome]
MEEPVDEKMGQMILETLLKFKSLAFNRLARDDDIAQHRARHSARFQRKSGERQDIGRLVLVAPLGVDFPDIFIVGEDQRKFHGRFREGLLLFPLQKLNRRIQHFGCKGKQVLFRGPAFGLDADLNIQSCHCLCVSRPSRGFRPARPCGIRKPGRCAPPSDDARRRHP